MKAINFKPEISKVSTTSATEHETRPLTLHGSLNQQSPTELGYLDLQVNGYGGVDFNSESLSGDELHTACLQLESDHVAGILLTLITDDLDRMVAKLKSINALRLADPLAQRLILGVHIEGPFISSEAGYVGAHPSAAVRPASIDAMQRLLDAADGLTKLVTLAPECDAGLRVTRMLVDQGVRVSAGHCNPTLDQLDAAIDAGLSMFTHLGNGCPLQLHRHDNIIQRVLSRSDRIHIGLIADGIHVPWPALRNYLTLAGIDRCWIVTDAISAAGLGPGNYALGNQNVVVDADGGTWAKDRSHLVGSAATMPMIAGRLMESLSLTESEVTQLTRSNPAALLGLTL